MKKTIISAAFLGLSLFFFSCKKDKEETALSPSESKTTLNQTASSLKTDLTSMVENESVDAFDNFRGIIDNLDDESNVARKKKKSYKGYVNILKDALNNAGKASNARMASDDFDFATTKGTYEWDFSIEDFKKTASSTDKLIIKFPSEENGTTNDATLTVNAYSEDANENPTKIDMKLTQNTSTILSIYYTASYDSNNEPTSFDGTVSMPPFTYSADLKRASTSVTFNTKIQNANMSIPIASTSFNGTFSDNTYENIEKFNGSAQLYEITMVGDINAKEINSKIENEDNNEVIEKVINDNAKVYLKKTSTSQKMGDVVIDITTDSDGEETSKFYVQYTDNSKEDLEVVFEKVIDELEEVSEKLEEETEEVIVEEEVQSFRFLRK